jgi:primosomal protein N'
MIDPPKGISILGPALCYREKLRDYYRMQLILKSNKELDINGFKLHKYYKSIISNQLDAEVPSTQRLIIDINPVSLL